jgi:hypothetical protein
VVLQLLRAFLAFSILRVQTDCSLASENNLNCVKNDWVSVCPCSSFLFSLCYALVLVAGKSVSGESEMRRSDCQRRAGGRNFQQKGDSLGLQCKGSVFLLACTYLIDLLSLQARGAT